ncbi:MAG: tetratricopeptide repeat protein [Candidatus Hydrogenedentes bacterium]|nr:tetratricopeptide repeat protein [Candidatus Hydrogenedentota bacterium]
MRGTSSTIFIQSMIALVALCGAASAESTAAEYNADGVQAYNAKDWENAVASFENAYKLERTNPTVRRNLCNALQAQANEYARGEDFDTATRLLAQAITVDPENASPLIQLGSYYLHVDMNADAAARLAEAVELDPSNLDAQELLGDAYYKQTDVAAAVTQWEYVKEKDPARRGLVAKLEKANREASVENNFSKSASSHFEYLHKPNINGVDLNKVLRILERAYREIGIKSGGVYPPSPIQVSVYDAEDFEKATLLGEHVGAVYDGKIRVPIRDKAGNILPEDELTRRLYHEYTHVIVRSWAGDKVPWWFNEGLAETFSNDMSDAELAVLREANTQDLLFKLADLEQGQLKKLDPDALHLAYQQAHATVDFLWGKYGVRGLSAMLENLRLGNSAEESLVLSYRLNYLLLEKEVAQTLGNTLAQR